MQHESGRTVRSTEIADEKNPLRGFFDNIIDVFIPLILRSSEKIMPRDLKEEICSKKELLETKTGEVERLGLVLMSITMHLDLLMGRLRELDHATM